jgi:hypothetical protein
MIEPVFACAERSSLPDPKQIEAKLTSHHSGRFQLPPNQRRRRARGHFNKGLSFRSERRQNQPPHPCGRQKRKQKYPQQHARSAGSLLLSAFQTASYHPVSVDPS